MNKTVRPVMAINPYTEKMVNVEPVFRFINEYTSSDDCYVFTDEAIKFMALSPLPEWTDIDQKGSVVMFLYQLRETFSQLKECEISIPKKKGASQ